MRRSSVSRNVVALSGLFVGACIALALVVGPGPRPAPETACEADKAPGDVAHALDVSAGARLCKSRCERYHTLDESHAPSLEVRRGTDVHAAWLAMLQRHRKSSAQANGPITDASAEQAERRFAGLADIEIPRD